MYNINSTTLFCSEKITVSDTFDNAKQRGALSAP